MNLLRQHIADIREESAHVITGNDLLPTTEKRIPFATMTFHLNTTVYRKNGDELVKANNERIFIGAVEPVIAVHEDGNVAELTGGRFVKDVLHQNPTIYYGILEVVGEAVKVCTRNGLIQRKLCRNQRLKVKSVKEQGNGVYLYEIGKNEYVSSLEPIRFIKGYVALNKAVTLSSEHPISLLAHKPYAFSHSEDCKVFLTDLCIWLDISKVPCTINHHII